MRESKRKREIERDPHNLERGSPNGPSNRGRVGLTLKLD